MTELRLQQDAFVWHWNTYPQYRGLFFRIKNEDTNRISGARNKASGVIPGVADSCLLTPHDGAIFIEFKLPGQKQTAKQKEWEKKVFSVGGLYYVVDTLDSFKNICKLFLG